MVEEPTTDERDSEAEVEGHGIRGNAVEQPRDVADEASATEVEGHGTVRGS